MKRSWSKLTRRIYMIAEVNSSHIGFYKCVAENIVGNASSVPIYLFLIGKPKYPLRILVFIIFCKNAVFFNFLIFNFNYYIDIFLL